MKNILFSLSFMLVGFLSFAQTGPGGVGNSSNNTVWLDANKLSLSDNDPVSILNDQSGNNNHVFQGTASAQPTFRTNQLNNLPALQFDGSSDFLSFHKAIPGAATTTFMVNRSNSNGYKSMFAINNHHYSYFSNTARSEFNGGDRLIAKPITSFSLTSFSTTSDPT